MNTEKLAERDYFLLIDQSFSMTTPVQSGRTRWQHAQEMAAGFAGLISTIDKDGITVTTFNNNFKEYDGVADGATAVNRIFQENSPNGGTDTAKVLEHTIKRALANKEKHSTILVVTDGVPNDMKAVEKLIIETTKKMEKDEELAISFIQVGNDAAARTWLKKLDDDLQSAGAKFDIVDTKTFEEIEESTPEQVLIDAIND